MTNKGMARIQRGQAITFRIPSDTPDHIMKQLQKLKETERRNFSSTIAEFALEGVGKSLARERETLTIPLPKQLTKEQRNWLKHSHSEALLGSIVYQLLVDPIRATTILASLNSNALDIEEALYLQERETLKREENISNHHPKSQFESEKPQKNFDINEMDEWEDDLMNFDWDQAKQEHAASVDIAGEDVEEETVENLLGNFLANMNK